ncbi:hypothetical protein B566_EDAN000906 [Ephemera danica]|nr:hypothetical protein B566_EDAN000906 [Ephemera danica]
MSSNRKICNHILKLMERNIRYEMVASTDEESQATAQPVMLTVVLPPEPLGDQAAASAVTAAGASGPAPMLPDGILDDIPPPKADFSAPPPYELATKLPSYEEAQQQKRQEEQRSRDTAPQRATAPPLAAFLAIDADLTECDTESSLLGTDFMFFTAFLVAFLFNWIGFLLLMCFCHTIAARYGALSGFGLSLAKWTLIVKHSTDLASRENIWLWWLIMAFGLLICVRAIIQYLHIKREWRLLSRSAQERLVFFY